MPIFPLVHDIFISLCIVTQCLLFLLMSWCIVCLLDTLKTHRWQSTLSGVNSKFRWSWYWLCFHPECLVHICGPYSLLYLVPSPFLLHVQMSVGTHCACRLVECTHKVNVHNPLPVFSVTYVPIPLMLTFTNANPNTDAQICRCIAISATSQRFDWRFADSSAAWAKLGLALDLGSISQGWFPYRCLTFTWLWRISLIFIYLLGYLVDY